MVTWSKIRGNSSDEGFVDYPMSNTTKDASLTQDKIKQYLATNSLVEFDSAVTEDSDLFKEGFIDSFGYIELVKYLEKEFQIRFTDEELVSNQLNTLKNITCMVHSKIDAG
jgi:D-alanine--poly(phosphoribitol) ligase subunit 2